MSARAVRAAVRALALAVSVAPPAGAGPGGLPAAVAIAPRGGPAQDADPGTRILVDLSGPGWTLALEPDARWEHEPLHAPPVALADVARPIADAAWAELAARARPVAVPGTVEGELGHDVGDYRGVSWWMRAIAVPPQAAGRQIVLRFAAVRLRAEVYLDGVLVGYDAVGNSPFDVDVSAAVRPGATHALAVRVTDPGGNFDWTDDTVHWWGTQPIPPSHGFGGVTGPVTLVVHDAVHVADVFVRNTPAVTEVEVEVEIANAGADAAAPDVVVELLDAASGAVVARAGPRAVAVEAGARASVRIPLSAPGARAWSPEDPALHVARVALSSGDALLTRCGLRWFAVDRAGADATFRLNGRRIVLRSAISWGYWPTTGLVPTADLAARQVQAARALGLNMLNHHRAAPAPGLLDEHDTQGLLAYTEPGGYWCQGGDATTFALARAKWLRLVRRDRNHPALVIRNMINEATVPPDARVLGDVAAAVALDDTRLLTYTSAWSQEHARALDLHVLPGEARPIVEGWHDQHHAPGPGVWRDASYRGPADFARRTDRRDAIVFLGEESAIAAPPRLEALVAALDPARPGWDGEAYRAWRDGYASFLREKGLLEAFGGLDALLASLGDVALDHHARTLETLRAADVVDAYVINGWESQVRENHSGIVDARRAVKGDVAILARANAPTRLVVRPRRRVLHGALEGRDALVPTDVWLVDESGARGSRRLVVRATDAHGAELFVHERAVVLEGGERYGSLLAEGVPVRVSQRGGPVTLVAELHAPDGQSVPELSGRDTLWLASWRERPPPAADLATWFGSGTAALHAFLRSGLRLDAPRWDGADAEAPPDAAAPPDAEAPPDAAGATDATAGAPPPSPGVVLVAGIDPEPREAVPPDALLHPDAPRAALVLSTRARGRDDPARVHEITGLDHVVDARAWAGSAAPDGVLLTVEGRLLPPETGTYGLALLAPAGARLWIDGALVLDEAGAEVPRLAATRLVDLVQDAPAALRIEADVPPSAVARGARVALAWTRPARAAEARGRARALLDDVAAPGGSLLLLTHADAWARLLGAWGVTSYDGVLTMGRAWMGGGYFVRDHPMFAGLPTGGAMGWPYQELVHDDLARVGLRLRSEEVLVGCVSDHQPVMATAVGIVPCGRGRVVLSTLDVLPALASPEGAADVARQSLAQMIAWAADEASGAR